MIRAAGIMATTPEGLVLLLKRGGRGDHPSEWCFPGGQAEGDETPEECAIRETEEESGHRFAAGDLKQHTRGIAPAEVATVGDAPAIEAPEGAGSIDGPPTAGGANVAPSEAPSESVDFTTFKATVPAPFPVRLNDEHTGYAWADIKAPPEPLHPGARLALDRLGMNELGIARAMAAGQLTSPQRYENVWLFVLRISGTGVSYRDEVSEKGKVVREAEFVQRDPEVWLSDDMVARCAGLPVIYEHPKKSLLTSKEFNDRVIGSVMLPFTRGPDLMGVAKVYDQEAAVEMATEPMSTSPGVNFGVKGVNLRFRLPTGDKVLVEGDPSLVDHIAVCAHGVWDKGGAPTGVENEHTIINGEMAMADEAGQNGSKSTEISDSDKRFDALVDMMKDACAKLDSGAMQMDAFGKRMDAMEEDRKADAARMDTFEKKGDEPEDKKDARKDNEDEPEEKGEPKETVGDKRKDARKDSEKEGGEKREDRKDAKKDDDEDEDRKVDARVDAALQRAGVSDIRSRIERIEPLIPARLTPEERERFSTIQASADPAYQAFADRAPAPLEGETHIAYQRRLAAKMQEHSSRWSKARLSAIVDEATLDTITQDIYTDAMAAARKGMDLPTGQIRGHARTTAAGHTIIEYDGSRPSWMDSFSGRAQAGIGNWKVPGLTQ